MHGRLSGEGTVSQLRVTMVRQLALAEQFGSVMIRAHSASIRPAEDMAATPREATLANEGARARGRGRVLY